MSFEDDPIEVRQYRSFDNYIFWRWGIAGEPNNALLTHTFLLHKGEIVHTEHGVIQRNNSGNVTMYDAVYDIHTTACIDEPTIHGEVVNVKV